MSRGQSKLVRGAYDHHTDLLEANETEAEAFAKAMGMLDNDVDESKIARNYQDYLNRGGRLPLQPVEYGPREEWVDPIGLRSIERKGSKP